MRRSCRSASLSARTSFPQILPSLGLDVRARPLRRGRARVAGTRAAPMRFTMAARGGSRVRAGAYAHEADPDALSAAPGRVASIVGAAERAAAELREQAELRSRERIAEAERAAENRVLAADEEAEETLASARAEAEATTQRSGREVDRLHAEAEQARDEAVSTLNDAREQAATAARGRPRAVRAAYARRRSASPRSCARRPRRTPSRLRADAHRGVPPAARQRRSGVTAAQELRRRACRAGPRRRRAGVRAAAKDARRGGGADLRRKRVSTPRSCCSRAARSSSRLREEADGQAREIRAHAREEAREITSDAHVAAREVLDEGTEVSRNLRELSVSLRNNAERLLRDITLAHGGMTARLDQVSARRARGARAPHRADGELSGPRQERAMTRISTCPSSSPEADRRVRAAATAGALGFIWLGAIAQLGERVAGSDEVVGSSPTSSIEASPKVRRGPGRREPAVRRPGSDTSACDALNR